MVVLLGIIYASLLAASISFRAVLVENAIASGVSGFFHFCTALRHLINAIDRKELKVYGKQ